MSYRTYVIRRTAGFIPKLFLGSIVIFLVVHFTPGDPITTLAPPRASAETIAQLKDQWRLDEPVYVQYLAWIANFVQGNLGISTHTREPVLGMISWRIPITLRFSALAILISYTLAIPIGIISAMKQHSIYDYSLMGFVLLMVSFPSFWIAIVLILIFSIHLNWTSAVGYGTLGLLVLPALAIGLRGSAIAARVMRSSMVEQLGEQYVTALRAHGLPERNVILKHAVRNALIPIITLLGLRVGYILGAGVVVEVVFQRPGIGSLLIDSIFRRDFPVVRSILMIFVAMIMTGNFLADVLYGFVDPRISYD